MSWHVIKWYNIKGSHSVISSVKQLFVSNPSLKTKYDVSVVSHDLYIYEKKKKKDREKGEHKYNFYFDIKGYGYFAFKQYKAITFPISNM